MSGKWSTKNLTKLDGVGSALAVLSMHAMRLASTMTRSRALRVIPSILWVVGLLAGIGLFLRALRFVGLLATDSYWGSLVWVVPAVLAVAWLAITVLWYRDTRYLMPPHMLVLSTLPFVPIAVLGILLHPPFHTGMGILIEISDIIHHMRGGGVLLGTIVAAIIYLHAVIGRPYAFGITTGRGARFRQLLGDGGDCSCCQA